MRLLPLPGRDCFPLAFGLLVYTQPTGWISTDLVGRLDEALTMTFLIFGYFGQTRGSENFN